jgi:hypothetical protein
MSSAPLTPLPPVLGYDDLPPGSDIRRELADGRVQISVPAGELSRAAVKRTLYAGLASGAASSWALLLLALVVFFVGLRVNRISGVALVWAWGFFTVFCAALVLLVGWVRFGLMLDATRAGRRQATALAATADHLLVETAGPFGVAAYDLPAGKIRALLVTRGILRDDRAQPRRVPRLTVVLTDGRSIHLLPGRDVRELEWTAAILKRTLGVKEKS